MKTFLLIFLLAVFSVSFGQNFSDLFVIKGEVSQSSIKKLFLKYIDQSNETVIDSVSITDGKFHFIGKIKNSTQIFIYSDLSSNFDSGATFFYVEPEEISLSIKGNDLKKMLINERQTHLENQLLDQLKIPIAEKVQFVYEKLQTFDKLKSQTKNPNDISKLDDISKALQDSLEVLQKSEIETEINFIKTHKTSFVSLERLLWRIYRSPKIPDIDSIDRLYDSLSIIVKESPEGRRVKAIIEKVQGNKVGKVLPSFKFTDNQQNEFDNLIFKKYKYVLIDFWSSWCVPSRADFPELKKVYSTYHNRGFEIISLSKDKDTLAYKQALHHDGISLWINGLMNDSLEKAFHVPAVPIKYLINSEGKIVGRWRGGGSENMSELKGLLEKNL